jgi:Uma2 family endonuclease
MAVEVTMARPEAQIKFTYRDYRSLPESETKRFELWEGELVLVPSPTTYHQHISKRLEIALIEYVEGRGLGEVFHAPLDVILSEEIVLQPDIIFIAREHSEIIAEEGIRGAPDLVVEILSPTTAERDRTYKRTLYARYGIREYWLVDSQEKTIEVLEWTESGYRRSGLYRDDEVLSSPLLEMEIELSQIF